MTIGSTASLPPGLETAMTAVVELPHDAPAASSTKRSGRAGDLAIRATNLSKRFRIGRKEKPETLAQAVLQTFKAPIHNYGKLRRLSRFDGDDSADDVLWALKDVSFDLMKGEALGIIGRNGAGKSTLLKVLSRITPPSAGQVELHGRVASLLEVGTGFHPELTGRENVWMNGAILGMTRREIARKFDEIVEFAGVDRFIDTPIKRYSSGMKVRLAFAVAAHLEADIVIVDEVLAVGDAEFQSKCLGKMNEVAHQGRTVLFVSHNLSAVQSLCDKGLFLQEGRVLASGAIADVVHTYLEGVHPRRQAGSLLERTDRSGSGEVRTASFRVLNSTRGPVDFMNSGEDYCFEVGYVNSTGRPLAGVEIRVDVFDDYGRRLLALHSRFQRQSFMLKPDSGVVQCSIRDLPLSPGAYSFAVFICNGRQTWDIFDYIEDVFPIKVEGGDFFATGSPGDSTLCRVLHRSEWNAV
jgi:lipopolysaccharide transport system ATP-binding protein